MINIKSVYKLQSDYNVAEGSFRDAEITFEEYMNQCRVYLTKNLPEEYHKGGWDAAKKQEMIINLASSYVDQHRVKVRDYVSPEGLVDYELLLADICDAVTGASILKEALEDPEVDEIQINDKNTIFVAKRGILQRYVDSKGRVMRFVNNDEIHIVLNKLIDDGTGNTPQFTDGLPILNAKTAKNQYRVNAVHHVANTMDKPPSNFPITTVVIRKFKETKLTIEDLINGQAITDQMGRLLQLFGLAELKLFCVGPTGSGKTTLLNIVANTIPFDKRIILVQNPTEISFMERDEYGRNTRNVVHWEVGNSASMEVLISNTLRATPEVIIVGEAREAGEFLQIQRAMRTGHRILGTFHAEDAVDGVERFAGELSTLGTMSETEAVKSLAKSIDIIISQFRFPDGRRRVMEIAEVTGVDSAGNVQVNKLFEFKLTGKTHINQHGLKVVEGEFKQVGYLSDYIVNLFYKAGIDREQIKEFMAPADDIAV